jgi:hypothetical protein
MVTRTRPGLKLYIHYPSSLTTNYEPVGLFYDFVWIPAPEPMTPLVTPDPNDLLHVNNLSIDNFETAQSFRSYRSMGYKIPFQFVYIYFQIY